MGFEGCIHYGNKHDSFKKCEEKRDKRDFRETSVKHEVKREQTEYSPLYTRMRGFRHSECNR